MGQRTIELMRDCSDMAPLLVGVTSAQYRVRSSPSVVFSAARVSATQPVLSASASRSRAQRSASVRLSNDLALGGTPRRRTYACHRPLSLRIVAIVKRSDHLVFTIQGRPRRGAKGYSRAVQKNLVVSLMCLFPATPRARSRKHLSDQRRPSVVSGCRGWGALL